MSSLGATPNLNRCAICLCTLSLMIYAPLELLFIADNSLPPFNGTNTISGWICHEERQRKIYSCRCQESLKSHWKIRFQWLWIQTLCVVFCEFRPFLSVPQTSPSPFTDSANETPKAITHISILSWPNTVNNVYLENLASNTATPATKHCSFRNAFSARSRKL